MSLSADCSVAILQARGERDNTFEVLKEKNPQPRILYPARLSFRFNAETRSFTDK